MPRSCELCHDAPAAVFRPTIALCRHCKRDLDTLESFDNECDNCPTCHTCGTVLNQTGVCPTCVLESLTRGHRAMVSRG